MDPTQEEALAMLRRDREERERKKNPQYQEQQARERLAREAELYRNYYQAQQQKIFEVIVPPDATAITPTPLPESVRQILASKSQLTSLPDMLPANLLKLDISQTRITSLPPLPKMLEDLDITNTPITALPALPNGLTILRCAHTTLNALPDKLPESLILLDVGYTPLTKIPILPKRILAVGLSNMALEDIPLFPASVIKIQIKLLPNPKRNPRFDAIVDKYNTDNDVEAFKQAIAEEKRNVYKVGTMKKVSTALGGPEYLGPLLSTYTTGLPYGETAKRTKELEKKGGKKTRRRNMRKKRTMKRKARRT
jgi:hypothetical protein